MISKTLKLTIKLTANLYVYMFQVHLLNSYNYLAPFMRNYFTVFDPENFLSICATFNIIAIHVSCFAYTLGKMMLG